MHIEADDYPILRDFKALETGQNTPQLNYR